LLLGILWTYLGQKQQAKDTLLVVIKKAPKPFAVLQLYYQYSNAFPQNNTLSFLEQIHTEDSSPSLLSLLLADVYFQEGLFEKSQDILEPLLQSSPPLEEVLY
jgi:tetratricopeptide (TPR) repeat protein